MNSGKNLLFLDLETDGLLPEVETIHCMGFKWLGGGPAQVTTDSEVALEVLNKADIIVAHNGLRFDFPVLAKIWGWTPKPNQIVRDTRVMAVLGHPDIRRTDFQTKDFPNNLIGRHSLKAWGVRLGNSKDDYEGGWDVYTSEMGEYCKQDVEILADLYDHCVNWKEEYSFCCWLEHEFAKVIDGMCKRGVLLDQQQAVQLYSSLAAEREALRQDVASLMEPHRSLLKTPEYWVDPESGEEFGLKREAPSGLRKRLRPGPRRVKVIPPNPESRQQVAEHFIKQGWEPETFTPSGQPEVSGDILRHLDYPEAEKFARLFDVAKLAGTIAEGNQAYLKVVSKDGRIRGRVNHNGAATGRCTHSKPNLANPPRDAKVRALFIPKPGWKMMGWDASGLELRMFCHYLGNRDYTDIVVDGDIHSHHQKILGLKTRDEAKTFIYAFLYGAGDPKLGSIILPDADAGQQSRVGRTMRARFLKGIPGLAALTRAVQEKAENQGYLWGLDGRRLPVRSKHSALNTLLQSAGAVVMKLVTVQAQQVIDSENLEAALVLHVHDEVQFEGSPGSLFKLSQSMEDIILTVEAKFNLICPLAGESKFGDNWSETH